MLQNLVRITSAIGIVFLAVGVFAFYIACTVTLTTNNLYSDTVNFGSTPSTNGNMTSGLNAIFGVNQDVLVRHVEMRPHDYLNVGFTDDPYGSSNGTVYVVLLRNVGNITDANILSTSAWSLDGHYEVTFINDQGGSESNSVIGIYLASANTQNTTFSVYTELDHYGDVNWYIFGDGVALVALGAAFLSAIGTRRIADNLKNRFPDKESGTET